MIPTCLRFILRRRGLSAVAMLGASISLAASYSSAAPIFVFSGLSGDGDAISGTAEFTRNAAADTLTIKLTNTTPFTHSADELLTGLDFSLGGLTAVLVSDTAIQRDVDADGNYFDTLTPQDISWGLDDSNAPVIFKLVFNDPNAEDSIIGPPTNGDYSGANGSIKGNNGHNPFAAEMAVFEFDVEGLEDTTPISVSAFLFGTALVPGDGIIKEEIPEPASWILLSLAVGLGARMRRRS